MPTRFDCEDEPNEFMDMPCMCGCGKWFDLNDGYGHGGKVVCGDCHKEKKKAEDLRNDYWELERGEKPYKREKKKILEALKKMGEELEPYR